MDSVMMDVKTSLLRCSECSIEFWVCEDFERRRRADHATFYCPNGHSQYFPQKSDVDKLRDLLREERVRCMAAEEQRDTAKRKLERVKSGQCPYCERRFRSLSKHIASRHKPAK